MSKQPNLFTTRMRSETIDFLKRAAKAEGKNMHAWIEARLVPIAELVLGEKAPAVPAQKRRALKRDIAAELDRAREMVSRALYGGFDQVDAMKFLKEVPK